MNCFLNMRNGLKKCNDTKKLISSKSRIVIDRKDPHKNDQNESYNIFARGYLLFH